MNVNQNRFWVIGGRFRDMTFSDVNEPALFGPFDSHRDAFDVWRRMTAASTANALTRYMIAAE